MPLILIADDNSKNLYLLESLLKGYGYEVTSAVNGAEALELARQSLPDLIITDIFMPVMDGFALCREWMSDERLKGIPFIFYTATFTDPKDEEFALNLGAERFLTKPQQPEVMRAVVRQVLNEAKGGGVERTSADERETLHQYTQVLFRKLEQKVAQLESEIAERQAVQVQLSAAADDWLATFDSIQDLIMILGPDFRIQRVNAAAASFFALPLDQIIGSGCHSLMHKTEARATQCPVAKVFQTRRHEEMEIFHEEKKSWLLVSADPILDANGDIARVVHTVKDITERKTMEEQLQSRLREIDKLKKQLEQENISLREEVKFLSPHSEIVAKSPEMQQVMFQVEQVAPTDSTVLITGETGTGKEVIARSLHEFSTRKGHTMVAINCASLPPTLIESELFGRERGAFTGAMSRMIGRFEIANGSTLFLDEIGDLPLEVQAKLLRVLEEGRFERLGSTKSLKVDVRIVAATNRNLGNMVQEGSFRRDLYYRLNVFPIVIPPLRERADDIPLLVWSFIRQFEKRMGRHIESIPKRSMDALLHYPWPGNARELRNVIEHAMIVSRGPVLEVRPPVKSQEDIPEDIYGEEESLEANERRHIMRALQNRGWRVSGKGGAAEFLGLKPTTLEARMKKLGIQRPKL
ncbi:MAG: sigma 54-interacting transcriptional regulator [Syntrophobacteraceae bacterium]